MATSQTIVVSPTGGLQHSADGLGTKLQVVNPSLQVDGSNQLGVKHDSTIVDTNAGLSVPSSSAVIYDLLAPLSLSAESLKDFQLDLPGSSAVVALGRLYITSPAAFSDVATLTFYNNPAKKDDQIIFSAQFILTLTTLTNPASAGGSSIVMADTSRFINGDLIYLQGANPEFRRVLSIASSTISLLSLLANNHLLGDGVSNAPEFGSFVLWDTSSSGILSTSRIYGRLSFTAARTINVSVALSVRA